MPAHKIDGKKCKAVIGESMKDRKERAESIILLEAELKLAERLKELYKKEMLKWANRENALYMKILKIKKKIKALL